MEKLPMRQEIFKDKEQEIILQDEDTEVEEDFPTYKNICIGITS
jgi:hypothetical protein